MECRLADVLKNKTQGVNTTTDKIKYVDGGYKIVQAKNIEQYNITFDEKNYIDEETYNRVKENHKLHKGDVLYTNIGSQLGNSALYNSDEKAIITWNVMKLIPNEKFISSEFLCYLLNYNKLKIKTLNSSSTMPFVSGKELMNFEINIPTLEIQNKITKILDIIQSKIKLNNQINDNLHKLLKNIYQNTFIDNKKEDWIEDKLGNYLDVERGLSYKGKFLADDGTLMINLGNVMPDGVFRLEKNKYYTGEYKEKVTATVGDIVVANTDMTQNREVLGTPVIIPPIYNDKVIFSHHIYGLKNLKLPKMYVFYSLLTDEWNGIAGGSATGTTVLALPKDAIEEYMITIPDETSLKRFEDLAVNIQNKREKILLENLNLEQLRDTLLPKLMNGEIDLDKIEI